MAAPEKLLIFGASARAAAFSALRAGLEPWCADLFADADLRARCRVTPLPSRRYPHGFLKLAKDGPLAPWIYTGGLENYPDLVRSIARCRALWGNNKDALELARTPAHLVRIGCPAPILFDEFPETLPSQGQWLIKPLAGAGGAGIRFWQREEISKNRRVYMQEYVQGKQCAAVYVADNTGARLLGVTQQLVGEPHVNAGLFRYCGSIGPLRLSPYLTQAFQSIGKVVARGCGLRGLFGIDCILRYGLPCVVEVNPRYTASVEILEYATGKAALDWHRWACDSGTLPSLASGAEEEEGAIAGKAILFARRNVCFPKDGPWSASLRRRRDVWDMPDFADIPCGGERIAAGRPVLSFFARASSVAGCREKLWDLAADLDHFLLSR